jgi:hypothetical protein
VPPTASVFSLKTWSLPNTFAGGLHKLNHARGCLNCWALLPRPECASLGALDSRILERTFYSFSSKLSGTFRGVRLSDKPTLGKLKVGMSKCHGIAAWIAILHSKLGAIFGQGHVVLTS